MGFSFSPRVEKDRDVPVNNPRLQGEGFVLC